MESIYKANPSYNPEAYDRCLRCKYLLEKKCDGPNILAMSPKPRAAWLKALKAIRKISVQEIADKAEVATGTVDRVLAGDDIKDIKVNTLARICFVLIGTAGQFPCILSSEEGSASIVKSLSQKEEEIEFLKEELRALHNELKEEREDSKRKTDYLLSQIEKKDKMIDSLVSKI